MDYDQFIMSLAADAPPPGMSALLRALWFDGKDDWEASHNIAQDINDNNGSWLHAYLHRKEGDLFNAGYWYRKAGKKEPSVSLKQEWETLVKTFLA